MVTLILGKTLVFWAGIVAGIFFFGGLLARIIINKSENIDASKSKDFDSSQKLGIFDIEKKKRINKYIFRLSIIFILIHVILALLSSLFGIWL